MPQKVWPFVWVVPDYAAMWYRGRVFCNIRLVLPGQILLRLANFILYFVKFFIELPAFDCKICLVQNKICSVSLK